MQFSHAGRDRSALKLGLALPLPFSDKGTGLEDCRPRPSDDAAQRARPPAVTDADDDAVAESPRQRRRGAAGFLEIQERNPISRYRCILKHQRTSLIEQRAERTGRKVCRQKKRSVELAKSQCRK